MMIYGDEFTVEMVAGQRMTKGDEVCTLEYVEGSDIDDEAAYRLEDHPKGLYVGECIEPADRGQVAVVKFDESLTDDKRSVLLFFLKRRILRDTFATPANQTS